VKECVWTADDVNREIPPVGGVSISDFWIVMVWVWPPTSVDVNTLELGSGLAGGAVVLLLPPHDTWKNPSAAAKKAIVTTRAGLVLRMDTLLSWITQ
jgi:hypothetical protein